MAFNEVYKDQLQTSLNLKANTSTTLTGYGITDAMVVATAPSDLNTAVNAGSYRINSTASHTNHPGSPFDWGNMLVSHTPGIDTLFQMACAYSSNKMAVRSAVFTGGVWVFNAWQSIMVGPRVFAEASNAAPTTNSDLYDQHNITALAAAATIGAPTGTPTDGQKLIIRIKDNGTSRVLSWNAIFRALGTTLPTSTVISKTLYIGYVYNSADSKWDVIALAQE